MWEHGTQGRERCLVTERAAAYTGQVLAETGATRVVSLVGRLLAQASAQTGADRVARWLGLNRCRPAYGPVALFLVAAAVEIAVANGLQYWLDGTVPLASNLGSLVGLAGLALVVGGGVLLRRQYERTIDALPTTNEMGDAVADPEAWPALPHRTRALAHLSVALVYGVWVLFSSAANTYVGTVNPAVAWGRFVAMWAIYLVPVAEFVTVVLVVHVLLPYRIHDTEIVDFTDPHRFGGLRPVGRLLRNSSVVLAGGLLLFVVFQIVSSWTRPTDPVTEPILVSGTLLILGVLAGPIYGLHLHMRAVKSDRLERLREAVTEAGTDDESLAEAAFSEEAVPEYTHYYIKFRRVEQMREHPVDVALVVESLFVVAIPFAAHVTVNLLTSGSH